MPDRHEDAGSTQPAYRAYEIGENDRVISFEVIEATSDDDAVRQAHAIARGRLIELWDRGRLVVRIKAAD